MALDPTRRFTSRVENYRRYRPGYPAEVIALLRERCGLSPGVSVADLGAGTGIFTAQLLEAGARVWAVEPNRQMREAAERLLGAHEGFVSVAGSAEDSTLAAHAVSLVTASQAFHWFDPDRSRAEVLRILAPGGWSALVWNEHSRAQIPFLADYEALLRRHAPEFDSVRERRACGPAIRTFFGGEPERAQFAHRQVLDFEGLKGRTMSSSFVPEPGDPAHEPLLAGLRAVFERHQREGRITFPYETRVFFGQPHGRRGALGAAASRALSPGVRR
ncbi:MAG: class I SAM-dependent methyltransferase [Steroidobacteraceae bacterium]|jgi:SAM-dependent methyltransferase